jgi:hypothetical protein
MCGVGKVFPILSWGCWFQQSLVVFNPESSRSYPESSVNSTVDFALKLLLFSSQETCLLCVTWMISSRKVLKDPATLCLPADPSVI